MKNNKLINYSKLSLIILSIITNITFLIVSIFLDFILFPITNIVLNLLILITYSILIFNSKKDYYNHLLNLFVLNLLSLASIFLNILGLGCGEGCEMIIHAGTGIGIFIFPCLIITHYLTIIIVSNKNKEVDQTNKIDFEPSNNFIKYFKSLLIIISIYLNIILIILSCVYESESNTNISMAGTGIVFNIIICILYLICLRNSKDKKYIKVISEIVLILITAVSTILNFICIFIEDQYTIIHANGIGLGIFVGYLSTYLILKLIDSSKTKKDNLKNDEIITIKAKFSVVKIDVLNHIFAYKNDLVKIEDITDLEINGKNQYVEKSNIGEAILCGALFGGLGAAAGSLAGKRTKKVKWCDVYIKTSNPFVSVIYLKAKYENAIKICNTIFLLAKENNLNIKE